MKNLRLLLFACFLGCFAPVSAQVSPLMGIGNVQFFDNNGKPLTSGVLYSYQAGTSTQQATFTDSTGTVQNTNPIAFGSGARVSIWITTGQFYKFVLCAQNDGPSCAPSDVLFSSDQVSISSGGGGGGGSPFITGSANPATSGILRLSTGDTICWRNAAGSANLCFSKDSNDLLSWAGGNFKLPEVAAPVPVSGFDILNPNSTAHRFEQCSNGASCAQLVDAGVDINTSDQVTQWHFGSTATPLSGTAPTTNQYIQWNGTNIVGINPPESTLVATTNIGSNPVCTATSGSCVVYILPSAHTLVRVVADTFSAPSGCGVNAAFGVIDLTSSTVLGSVTPTTTGILDSGVLSVPIPAGDKIGIGVTTASSGCAATPFTNVTATYQ